VRDDDVPPAAFGITFADDVPGTTVTTASGAVVASASVVTAAEDDGRVAAPARSTPSGALPMTLTATTPASAVTSTPAAAPSTGSRR